MENILKIPQLEEIKNELVLINQKIDNLKMEKSIYDLKDLTRKETAKFLNICLTSIDRHRRNGLIKGYKIGRKRYYTKEDILKIKNLGDV